MIVDFQNLIKKIINLSIPKPLSGTLSGHSAGEPFDKLVYQQIRTKYPKYTFRQFEYLNYLFVKNPDTIGVKARNNLFQSPTLMFLLSRGKNATDRWSIDNPFEEKQNDTADILLVKNGYYELIDVKTRNISKNAQAPNIISAYKLAQLCAKMIDNNEFDTFTMNYLEVDWELEDNKLVCKNAFHGDLFKINPDELYINWAAAMQIQFHVANINQSFSQNSEEWAKIYLKHFVSQAKKRANDMIIKFVKPFEKYI